MFKQKFNNEHGGGAVGLLVVLLFSLTFSSFVIAFMLTQIYGVAVTGNNAGIELPNSGSMNTTQDYTNNSIDDSVNYVFGTAGHWVFIQGVGRVLTDNPSFSNCELMLKNVASDNGIYTVYYAINNTVGGDYKILVRYWTGANVYNIIVVAKDDGFHIPDGFTGLTDSYFFPYPEANHQDYTNIKTVFNENKGILEFYLNGDLVFTASGFWKPLFSIGTRYNAGVSSKNDGFTIESIRVTGFISLDPNDLLGQISSIFNVFTRLVLWNVDEQYLPVILNIIFIKTQLAGIIICAIAVYIRGVG